MGYGSTLSIALRAILSDANATGFGDVGGVERFPFPDLTLGDGNGDGNVNQIYVAKRTIAAGDSVRLNLHDGSLADLYGNPLLFGNVKTVVLHNTSSSAPLRIPAGVDRGWKGMLNVAGGGINYPDEVLADSPVAYYRCGDVYDVSGHGYDLTSHGSPDFARAGAVSTNNDPSVLLGAGGSMSFADDPAFKLLTAWTIECWINTPSASGPYALIWKGTSDARTYTLDLNGGIARTYVTQGGGFAGVESGASIPLNQWVHLAATYDGTTLRLYQDGVSVGTPAAVAAPDDSTGGFGIGLASDGSYPYPYVIDEVAVFGTALSANRIRSHYDAGVGNNAHVSVLSPAGVLLCAGTDGSEVSAVSCLIEIANDGVSDIDCIVGVFGSAS